ncbi:MAG: hypothetical protein K5683_08460 [Prevotella sp.]|nr:hypothetical protein [Prevotella sp.]
MEIRKKYQKPETDVISMKPTTLLSSSASFTEQLQTEDPLIPLTPFDIL